MNHKLVFLGIGVSLFAGIISTVLAWQNPAALPPGGNLSAPLNVSNTAQTKSGSLALGGLAVDTNTLYVDTANHRIGIGTTSPSQKLDVDGGVRWNTATSRSACDVTTRGLVWFTQNGVGVKDIFAVCAKDASDTYAWRTLY